jgi:hypothetical protein
LAVEVVNLVATDGAVVSALLELVFISCYPPIRSLLHDDTQPIHQLLFLISVIISDVFKKNTEARAGASRPRENDEKFVQSAASTLKSMNLSSGRSPLLLTENYGIIPWLHHDNQWYFLTQVGYSTMMHDFKVDPIRGKPKKLETTPWQTAVRAVKEESGPHTPQ